VGQLLKDRVEHRLRDLGINAFEAARRGELERGFVNDILNGKKQSVRGNNLARLARALEVPPEFLLLEDYALTGATRPSVAFPRSDTVQVPEYDVRLSAGGGALIEAEDVKGVWQFSRRYLVDELQLNPETLGIVTIQGDSMHPTLQSGDRVMIDHNDRNPARPGIYAIWDSNATVVKRLEKIPGSDPPMVALISDNKNHNTYTVPAELVNVIGRVVWFGRNI
jgi:phage repressor protein C with HTH and peptisase S24 domain